MNATTTIDETQVSVKAAAEAPKPEFSELQAVELAYIGGGMGNVMFM
jgi:hypothetical protein